MGDTARGWLADHAEDDTNQRRLWVGGPGDPKDPMPGSREFHGRLRFVRALLWLHFRGTGPRIDCRVLHWNHRHPCRSGMECRFARRAVTPPGGEQ